MAETARFAVQVGNNVSTPGMMNAVATLEFWLPLHMVLAEFLDHSNTSPS